MYHKNRLNFRHRPAVCAGNFALVASAAADRNRSAQFFSKRLLAVPYSAVLQKISIFENAASVRFLRTRTSREFSKENSKLNETRCFSGSFKPSLKCALQEVSTSENTAFGARTRTMICDVCRPANSALNGTRYFSVSFNR